MRKNQHLHNIIVPKRSNIQFWVVDFGVQNIFNNNYGLSPLIVDGFLIVEIVHKDSIWRGNKHPPAGCPVRAGYGVFATYAARREGMVICYCSTTGIQTMPGTGAGVYYD